MRCSVPDCSYSSSCSTADVCSFVRFPENETLRDRWLQAIQLGSGVMMDLQAASTFSSAAASICSWHFQDQSLSTYQEPSQFLDQNGKFAEVGSCRICLKFYHSHEMMSTDKKLQRKTISALVQKILGTSIMKADFLHKICEECLVKLDLCFRWIKNAKIAEVHYQQLTTVVQSENLYIQGNADDDKSLSYKFDFCAEELLETVSQDENCVTFEIDLEPKIEDEEQTVTSNKSMEFVAIEKNSSEDHFLQEQPVKRKPGRPRKNPIIEPECNEIKTETDKPAEKGPPKRRGPQPKPKKPKQDYKYILARKCYICNTLLGTHAELIGHLTTNHAAKIDYTCAECNNKTFIKVTGYNHHLSFHDLEFRPEKCGHCKIGFSTVQALKVHQNRDHGTKHVILKVNRRSQKGKAYQCDSCGKTFRGAYQLREHDDYYHKKIYNSTCTVCGKAFPSKTLLQKHYIVHSGEKTIQV
nr:myoneurin-like [Aedes albopictus]